MFQARPCCDLSQRSTSGALSVCLARGLADGSISVVYLLHILFLVWFVGRFGGCWYRSMEELALLNVSGQPERSDEYQQVVEGGGFE